MPVPPGPRGEKKLKNFLLILRGDALSGIRNGDDGEFSFAAQTEGDASAGLGEVARVQQKIQDGLMNQLAIQSTGGKSVGQIERASSRPALVIGGARRPALPRAASAGRFLPDRFRRAW